VRAVAGADLVPVESIEPGDEIEVGRQGQWFVVSELSRFEDGSVVVWYFRRGQWSFENRAGRTGASFKNILIELPISLRRADKLPVVRGAAARAGELRDELEREQAARWERMEERLLEQRA
jgi:hypothetical protein